MARKTPDEAAQTRQNIVEAARHLFYSKGVSATTLEHIARAAGVTRGAVYWHFADKAALVAALREQLVLSLVEHVDAIMLDEEVVDPLVGLEHGFLKMFTILEENEAVRETLDIWFSQGSFVQELAEASHEVVRCHKEFIAKLQGVYQRAFDKGLLRKGYIPQQLALDTDAFIVGLIRNWLLDACEVGVRQNVAGIIKLHVSLRRD